MSMIIMSHNNGEGARNLAAALDCKLATTKEAPFPRKVRLLINLGISENSEKDAAMSTRLGLSQQTISISNNRRAVSIASSKLDTLTQLRNHGVGHPVFTSSPDEANFKVLVEGKTMVARTLDRASQGRGIEVLTPERVRQDGGIVRANLYTEAIDKGREYRVHVGSLRGGYRVIDVQRKIRRPDVADTDRPFIWNHDNGFIFVRDGVNINTVPNSVLDVALRAVRALGLHFGAVDIVVPRRGRADVMTMPAYVLEVNTAPGMVGRTVQRYAEYFKAYCNVDGFQSWDTLPNDTEQEEV